MEAADVKAVNLSLGCQLPHVVNAILPGTTWESSAAARYNKALLHISKATGLRLISWPLQPGTSFQG